jgi:heme exporter protein A
MPREKDAARSCARPATLLAALERVGLAGRAHDRAAAFSRGMAQRLNLARLLLLRPALLLLDEPDTGLDAASSALLAEEIAAARDRGAAVLWASHRLERDLVLADRLIELANGRIRYDGPAGGFTPAEVPSC